MSPDQRRFLEPFLGRSLGAAQAARELGLPVEQLAYRVRGLTRQGLLRPTGQVARKGRPITTYAAAREVRAPLALLPYDSVHSFFSLVDAGLRERFLASLASLADRSGLGDWVVRLYRGDHDDVRLDLAPSGGAWNPDVLLADGAPAIVFNWVPLGLDAARAKQLQREMLALVGRYHDPSTPPTHLLGLFLTPADL